MKKLILLSLAMFLFGGLMAQNAIVIEPANATAWDEITLYLDVTKTCPEGALLAADSVMIHSGITLNGGAWSKVVAFDGLGINGQQPKLVKWEPAPYAITIDPPTASAWDEITLTLDANMSCPEGALLTADSVMMHSGVTIDGVIWQNVIAFDGTGIDGTKPKLTSNGDGTWSMTFIPAEFYGIAEGANVTAINCVFNGGAWTAGEGKAFDENGNCVDFVVPFNGLSPDHTWMITFTPAEFYGIEPGSVVTALDCVFNQGNWDAEGKDFDDLGNCADFKVMLSQPAKVQVIHNSADAAAAVVDVWLNDTKLLDDFPFRFASPFIDAPTGVEFTIAIKGPDSENPNDPIWSQNYTLEANKNYLLIASGIVSASGYDPLEPFDIYVYDMARLVANDPANTDVIVFHGSTDAPEVSIWEVTADPLQLVESASYGEFTGYLELPVADYMIQVRNAGGTEEVATYAAPLATFQLGGFAFTAIASGFLDIAANSDGPHFGLYGALPIGGALVPLQRTSSIETIETTTMKIYPNPVENSLNIEVLQDASKLEIYNVMGKKIQSFDQLTTGVMNISTANLAAGVYFINLHTESGVQTVKFLKK